MGHLAHGPQGRGVESVGELTPIQSRALSKLAFFQGRFFLLGRRSLTPSPGRQEEAVKTAHTHTHPASLPQFKKEGPQLTLAKDEKRGVKESEVEEEG